MRHDNWQTRLTELIHAKRDVPADFPNHNCLMWAFDAIEAVTGDDHSGPYRGKYKTEREAMKLLRKVGNGKTPADVLKTILGEGNAISFARQGDIVLLDPSELDIETICGGGFGFIPGVCYGQLSYFVGEQGLVEVETLRLGYTLWVS